MYGLALPWKDKGEGREVLLVFHGSTRSNIGTRDDGVLFCVHGRPLFLLLLQHVDLV